MKFEIIHVDTCEVMIRFDDLDLAKAELAILNRDYGNNYLLCHAGGWPVDLAE